MSKKIRVLIIPSDPFGVGHYRSIWPAQEIQKNHSDKFEVDIRLQQPVTDDDIGKWDIVHFHRRINTPETTNDWVKRFQESGAIVVMDMDDYWLPFKGHPVRDFVIKAGLHTQIMETGKLVDYVSTTTDIFEREINKNVNKKTVIIPNAVDNNMKMWQPKALNEKGDRVRVAWIGGSSHERDLEKLNGTFNKLFSDSEVKDKIQVVMCGYDTRGTITDTDPKTGKQTTRKIRPEESIWNKFEAIFNDSGRADKDQYVRRNTLPITRYGEHYNYCDICLAPLDEHMFNECKSELKIIETGMMGKALIASDLYVYKDILTHNENALLVDPRKNHKLWYRYIKELVLDTDKRMKLSNNLYNLVNPCYTLQEVTSRRCEWYEQILGR